MEKIKKIAVVFVFGAMIFGLAIAHFFLDDAAYSDTERRALAQKPNFSAEALMDGSYQSKLETYLLEQFPLRDDFRSVKTLMNLHLWQMKDTNGYYYADGHLMELDVQLNESQIDFAIKKFNGILEKHPQIAKAYYAVVPDKNYFLAEQNGYEALDYAKLFAQMQTVEAEKIELTDSLTLSDYYRTDSHWRQERLEKVVQSLCAAMGVESAPQDSYTRHTLEGFAGVYADHTAYPFLRETLCYLENDVIRNATVSRLDEFTGRWTPMQMYDTDGFHNADPYDLFLSGAQPLITIENPSASNDKHLILIRDSFSSSLAPLLTGSYAKITLVDLRYIASSYLDAYVDFEGADVLFLFSTTLLNSAGSAFKPM